MAHFRTIVYRQVIRHPWIGLVCLLICLYALIQVLIRYVVTPSYYIVVYVCMSGCPFARQSVRPRPGVVRLSVFINSHA